MKWLTMVCITAALVGCGGLSKKTAEETSENTMTNKVAEAISQAKKQGDYRLLATKGRRMVIPGLEKQQDEAIKHCDFKYLENTGDILRSEQQRIERSERYQFASDYNKAIYQLCLQAKSL